ncbi:MAG: methyltransferase domain-containing protein [Acidobacteria bacterium]|nr:methyltransferase domain-containing protein [Acidobacteriota bacterium]
MSAQISDVKTFWNTNPCNSRYSTQEDRTAYFEELEQRRYRVEWHIPIVAQFDKFGEKDVLEIGCGMGADGLQFARHGARYTGLDLTPEAVRISEERFELYGIKGTFEVGDAEEMPFLDNSFDHIYSFGVIHVSPDTEAIVRHMYRVLRPGGTFCVMVYNTTSINYYIEIMFLRKLFRWLLYPSFMPSLLAKLTGLDEYTLQGHRELLLSNPKMSKQEWLSRNTDGPYCPYAKVYTKEQVLELFKDFEDVRTEVWYFEPSHWSYLGKMLPASVVKFLGCHWGWHRMVYGRKPQ